MGVSRGVGGRVEKLADGGALVVHAVHRWTRRGALFRSGGTACTETWRNEER